MKLLGYSVFLTATLWVGIVTANLAAHSPIVRVKAWFGFAHLPIPTDSAWPALLGIVGMGGGVALTRFAPRKQKNSEV